MFMQEVIDGCIYLNTSLGVFCLDYEASLFIECYFLHVSLAFCISNISNVLLMMNFYFAEALQQAITIVRYSNETADRIVSKQYWDSWIYVFITFSIYSLKYTVWIAFICAFWVFLWAYINLKVSLRWFLIWVKRRV